MMKTAPQEHSREAIMNRCQIDDEWWRDQAISRMYYQLVLDGGRIVIVYRGLDGS